VCVPKKKPIFPRRVPEEMKILAHIYLVERFHGECLLKLRN
jgi:hypothetical protein